MLRSTLIWGAVGIVLTAPVVASAFSPLLSWRDPIYIIAGFAGVVAMSLMVLQPLAARQKLPGLTAFGARKLHRLVGTGLIGLILIHVIGLWLTSPPDVIDALLFRSPTPFSVWGVIAMWAMFLAALLVGFRSRLGWPWRQWRRVHLVLVGLVVGCTILHAALIEGTMESITKFGLSVVLLGVTTWFIIGLRSIAGR